MKNKYAATDVHGNCPFCKIVSGEMKTPGVFWENKTHMAFLSTFPNCRWNTVVISKHHQPSDILGLENNELSALVLAAKEVQNILLKWLSDVGRIWMIAEWTWIDHAHIKLYPMHKTGHMKEGIWKQYPSTIETCFDEYAGYLCSNDWPAADNDELMCLAKSLRSVAKW